MGFRLVALDVDGTIRSQEHGISDRTRAAIDAVGRAGATVTVAMQTTTATPITDVRTT